MRRSDGLHSLPWDRPREVAGVERPASKQAEALGWCVAKLMRVSKTGWPDRVFIRDGRTVWIEFKRPKGKARRIQEERHAEMRAHGAEVYVCDSVEAALAILQEV